MQSDDVDPTSATSMALKRRTFVGLAAAGAAAPVLASADSGGPHAPIVAEDDPSISVERVALDRDGVAIPAYAARPRGAHGAIGSVVVVMHIWGVDASIRDVVRRLAKAGFAAISPDLYARSGAPDGDGATDFAAFRPHAKALDRAQYDGDLAAAARWLATQLPGTRTSILGFCMGGRIAMQAAQDDAGTFAAVCPFYGSFDGVDPAKITMPLCGSYGGRDTSIPAASVEAFAAKLAPPHDVRVYDQAGHAFMDEWRTSYVASAADDAWRRTIAYLQKYGRPA